MTTQDRNRTVLALAAVVMAAMVLTAAPASALTVVYQDNFDNDTLATNAGIGGGLGRYSRQPGTLGVAPEGTGTWVDNGELSGNSTGKNDRGNVWSLNSFDVSAGFKLEVSYTISNVSDINANRVNIGLIDALPEVQNDTTYVTHFLAANQDRYGIGLNMTTNVGTQGLNFANDAGTGTLTPLSNAQPILTGAHSFVLEMDSSSNWSYSIDGATATTGTISGGFELSRDYQFFAFVQDYRNNQIKIHSVTLYGSSSALAGDTNTDGVVDAADYIALKQNFGMTGAEWKDGDFDYDTDVDWDDLQQLMANFGAGSLSAPATAPEPATLGLLAIGALALLRRRRK